MVYCNMYYELFIHTHNYYYFLNSHALIIFDQNNFPLIRHTVNFLVKVLDVCQMHFCVFNHI